ncbi:hypothetical protein ROJ8625_00714 [Roseivivax jejudonensis]|uniref:Uncharacterized protein n=1 Tax=Roseivivax jejudonensis TaxID=1529041 RepID=A0A1X6YFQ5_9RHOB|nr:hypothetical protein [Roseivivax jejudonensis]SLN20097.1 hypothetical protein ROJ8625_00714 [Roseivivax jejudonensis]
MSVRNIEELLFQMPTVQRRASDEWARTFAASIMKQSRRRNWRPSEKQEAIMRRLVSEIFGEPEDLVVIEED